MSKQIHLYLPLRSSLVRKQIAAQSHDASFSPTHTAKLKRKYPGLSTTDSLKLIQTFSSGTNQVKVYKDDEWGEFRARLFFGGKLYEPADYHSDDRADALSTAQAMLRNAVKPKGWGDQRFDPKDFPRRGHRTPVTVTKERFDRIQVGSAFQPQSGVSGKVVEKKSGGGKYQLIVEQTQDAQIQPGMPTVDDARDLRVKAIGNGQYQVSDPDFGATLKITAPTSGAALEAAKKVPLSHWTKSITSPARDSLFSTQMRKAIEAEKSGNEKLKKRHLENARMARLALTNKEIIQNRELLDLYKKMASAQNAPAKDAQPPFNVFRARVNLENFSNPEWVKKGGWSKADVAQTIAESKAIIASKGMTDDPAKVSKYKDAADYELVLFDIDSGRRTDSKRGFASVAAAKSFVRSKGDSVSWGSESGWEASGEGLKGWYKIRKVK